jgi:hypothetical protein
MSLETTARTGSGPVSRLADLPGLERRVVVCARRWTAGRDVSERALDDLLGLFVAHGRRPLQVGPVGAPGVSGDECVLARFVALAAEGAREDAVLIATLLVRADLALGLARTAEAFGLSLMRSAAR